MNMSGWFLRSPDAPRPKNQQRETGKVTISHHRQITPSLSAKNLGSYDLSSLNITKPTPLSQSPSLSSIATSEKGTEIEEPTSLSSTEMVELQKELHRLRNKEASLLHKLALEREHRVRAEQLVEVERLAFHELKYLLQLEEKKHSNTEEQDREEGGDFIQEGVDFSDANISEGLIVSFLFQHCGHEVFCFASCSYLCSYK